MHLNRLLATSIVQANEQGYKEYDEDQNQKDQQDRCRVHFSAVIILNRLFNRDIFNWLRLSPHEILSEQLFVLEQACIGVV